MFKDMNDDMKGAIVCGVIFLTIFLVVGWSIFLWYKYSNKPSVDELKVRSYYDCVQVQTVNHRDVGVCNLIEKERS